MTRSVKGLNLTELNCIQLLMTRSVKGLNLTELNCIQLGHQRLLEGDIRLLVSDQMDKTLHCCGVTLHNY